MRRRLSPLILLTATACAALPGRPRPVPSPEEPAQVAALHALVAGLTPETGDVCVSIRRGDRPADPVPASLRMISDHGTRARGASTCPQPPSWYIVIGDRERPREGPPPYHFRVTRVTGASADSALVLVEDNSWGHRVVSYRCRAARVPAGWGAVCYEAGRWLV